MICLQNANAYLKSRTLWDAWDEYSSDQKEMAITQARRDLSRALGRPMNDDEPPYQEGDKRRDEYAVYEQAIYTLLMNAQPKGGGSMTPSLSPDETKPKGKTLGEGYGKWSKEALAWLADKMTIVTRLA